MAAEMSACRRSTISVKRTPWILTCRRDSQLDDPARVRISAKTDARTHRLSQSSGDFNCRGSSSPIMHGRPSAMSFHRRCSVSVRSRPSGVNGAGKVLGRGGKDHLRLASVRVRTLQNQFRKRRPIRVPLLCRPTNASRCSGRLALMLAICFWSAVSTGRGMAQGRLSEELRPDSRRAGWAGHEWVAGDEEIRALGLRA